MSGDRQEPQRWWGRFSLEVGESGLWRLGPTSLLVSRDESEWRIARTTRRDGPEQEAYMELPSQATIEGEDVVASRFSVDGHDRTLWLTPRLADRAVVVYPEHPFYVPSGQHITLFCSSPLWLHIAVGDAKLALEEFPLLRPPDTWFGPTTREGELCYATRTTARLRRVDLVPRPHRAFTQLGIHNQTSTTLHLERVSLSVPYLTLYRDREGCFWTNVVSLNRTEERGLTELEIGAGPSEGLDVFRIADPRVARERNVMVRAFSALFSSGS